MPILKPYTELIWMLMLYNVRKGQIINQSREKKESEEESRWYTRTLLVTFAWLVWEENVCFGYRTVSLQLFILLCNEGSLGLRSDSKRDLNQRYK